MSGVFGFPKASAEPPEIVCIWRVCWSLTNTGSIEVLAPSHTLRTHVRTADSRVNRGRGRQIVPGQKIHKSVLNRLVHDRQAGGSLDAKCRYTCPAAKVAQGMTSWGDVRRGRRYDRALWEE